MPTSRHPARHSTTNLVSVVSWPRRSILLSLWPHPTMSRTLSGRLMMPVPAVHETETSSLVSASRSVDCYGSLWYSGSTDVSSDPMRWRSIDDCPNTCRCFTNDPIPDPSLSRLPRLTDDPVHSTPRPLTMNEQCNDNRPETLTVPELIHRTIHNLRTSRHMDTGTRTHLNNTVARDPSRKTHSTTWSLDLM